MATESVLPLSTAPPASIMTEPRDKEIHVIVDNLSAHKSRPVTDFLSVHPKVNLHFTPTFVAESNRLVVRQNRARRHRTRRIHFRL